MGEREIREKKPQESKRGGEKSRKRTGKMKQGIEAREDNETEKKREKETMRKGRQTRETCDREKKKK